MQRKRMFWQIFPAFLFVAALCLVLILADTGRTVRSLYHGQVRSDLETQARLLAQPVADLLVAEDAAGVEELCKALGADAKTRVTVIRPDGTVWGDSLEDPAVMDNHGARPEIEGAYGGEVGASVRFSHTLRKEMMYVAVPVDRDGRLLGVIRTSYVLADVGAIMRGFSGRLLVSGCVVALVAAAISLFFSRRFTRSLRGMISVARDFSEGNFFRRVPAGNSSELGELADALNLMAVRLDEQVIAVREQRNEEDAVLSSMLEGVLALGTDERVLKMNQGAADLLGVEVETACGLLLQEVVRNTDLQAFARQVLRNQAPAEADIVIHDRDMTFLQAHGTLMKNGEGDVVGALIVLNDVTRLRRLERLRRDFVANVSHELKTPITTIKGFVETLLDGALDEPENARRFLRMVAKHADRLSGIIEDLLSLSRIEQDNERGGMEREERALGDVLAAAKDACAPAAEAAGIALNLSCPETLKASVNSALLEQVVVNLVDNAIKYSDEGAAVAITAESSGAEVVIEVRDEGCGIEPEHLERIFERFYRVDKARSRELGGTGLGLAIVKHVAQAHGGRVSVSSEPGQGSRFRVHLPLRADAPSA